MSAMAREIAEYLGQELLGQDTEIVGPSTLDAPKPHTVVFSKRADHPGNEALASVKDILLIGMGQLLLGPGSGQIISPDPRLDFARVMQRFFVNERSAGVHPSAVIHPTARIDKSVFIGALTVVAENVEIGEGSTIHSGVHIYPRVKIGKHVVINSGTVVGADGFGYAREPSGEIVKIPHLGGVVIGDDVEIGAGTCIDRGTLSDTVIGEGTKIDNLVHIAHNVHVGTHCLVIAHAMIGGSVRIGDRTWVAPCACVKEQTQIGENAVIGLGAVVIKSVEAGTTVMGSPARNSDYYKKVLKGLDRLVNNSETRGEAK